MPSAKQNHIVWRNYLISECTCQKETLCKCQRFPIEISEQYLISDAVILYVELGMLPFSEEDNLNDRLDVLINVESSAKPRRKFRVNLTKPMTAIEIFTKDELSLEDYQEFGEKTGI